MDAEWEGRRKHQWLIYFPQWQSNCVLKKIIRNALNCVFLLWNYAYSSHILRCTKSCCEWKNVLPRYLTAWCLNPPNTDHHPTSTEEDNKFPVCGSSLCYCCVYSRLFRSCIVYNCSVNGANNLLLSYAVKEGLVSWLLQCWKIRLCLGTAVRAFQAAQGIKAFQQPHWCYPFRWNMQ